MSREGPRKQQKPNSSSLNLKSAGWAAEGLTRPKGGWLDGASGGGATQVLGRGNKMAAESVVEFPQDHSHAGRCGGH